MAPAFEYAEGEVLQAIEVGLDPDRFERGKKLGRGSFGTVYECRDKATKKMCAIKFVQRRDVTDRDRLHLRREIEIQSSLNHENILKCYGYFYDPTRIFVILDNALGGNMTQLIKKQPRGRCDERTAANYLQQLVRGLQYLHGKQIIHRDIKPDNLLLLEKDCKTLVIADFGCVVQCTNPSVGQQTVCGSINYMAPERIKQGTHTEKVDIWACGVFLYEMLVGSTTFEVEDGHTVLKILNAIVKIPRCVKGAAKALIYELLMKKPEDRISLDNVL